MFRSDPKQALQRISAAVSAYRAPTLDELLPQHALSADRASHFPAIFAGHADQALVIPSTLKTDKQIMLIGAGCFRLMAIATSITDDANQIAHMVVLDNSDYVITFWTLLKHIFLNSDDGEAVFLQLKENEAVLKALSANFCSDITWPFVDGHLPFNLSFFDSEMHELCRLINALISAFGFDATRSLVLRVKTALYDWTEHDGTLFQALSQHAQQNNFATYLYATDILSCLDDGKFEDNPKVHACLKNLSQLQPLVSIYRNRKTALFISQESLIGKIAAPDRFYCFQGVGDLSALKEALGYQTEIQSFDPHYPHLFEMTVKWTHGIYHLRCNEFELAATKFREIYSDYEAILSGEATYIEKFCLHYVLSRALGFTLLQCDQSEEGATYLQRSLGFIKQLYGASTYVTQYESEINDALEQLTANSAMRASS